MKARIRQATWVDAEDIAMLRKQIAMEIDPDADLPSDKNLAASMAELIANPAGSALWVAKDGERLVGFAHAEALGPGRDRLIALDEIMVVKGERRQKIATNLMMAAIGDMGALAYSLDSTPAIGFFRSCGFAPSGRGAIHEFGIELDELIR